MIVKQIIDEDFVNYKKPSMLIGFPICNWKCEKECGEQVCHNKPFAKLNNIDIPILNIIERYINNPITSAIVMGGLEPIDSWDDVYKLVYSLREIFEREDDIVIYTGYNKDEVLDIISILKNFKNIVIKFDRYVPNQTSHYDKILGVNLSSDNQYAERIS
jgi:hypothetical protein